MRAVGSFLQPGLENSVGAVQWTVGDASGVDWLADTYLPDGTNVALTVRLPDRTLSLVVDTSPTFKRYVEPGNWVNVALVGIVLVGIAVGFITWSFIWGAVCAVGIVGIWIAIDIAKQTRDERVAA